MLDEMRTFVILAESGSLQRAAERLCLTPSAVTRQIQRLEAELKTALLDRSHPRARRGSKSKDRDLDARWVLTAPGCFIRASLEARLRELGSPFDVAAAINNIDMQVSLVASGIGLALIPARFLASHPTRRQLERITRSGISTEASIVFMQAGHLGRLESAATFLQQEFRDHFAEREVH